MVESAPYEGGNYFLDHVPSDALASLRASLEIVELESGSVLYAGGAEYDLPYVYFPVTAVASMLATLLDGSSVEAGTVGREGIVGVQCVLGSPRMYERWITQVPGTAARMPLSNFRSRVSESAVLRASVQFYTQFYLAFLAQSIACNARHSLLMRCARWLLLTHDRTGRDEFFLTQEFLAIMLAVRRPAVSMAAATLARDGLIAYARGWMRVIDRGGLEAASCECYRSIGAEFDRLMADAPSGNVKASVFPR